MKSVENNITTLFIGSGYEVNVTTGETTKYYFAGAQRIAVRKYKVPQTMELNYLLSDHLGSTSLVTSDTGSLLVETRYKPCPTGVLREGEVRYTTPGKSLPTRFTFTGQYSYVNDEATDLGNVGFGLMYYGARFYDPYLGRFTSADTVVPNGKDRNINLDVSYSEYTALQELNNKNLEKLFASPKNKRVLDKPVLTSQSFDRFAYANNNPVKFVDINGHDAFVAFTSGAWDSYQSNLETELISAKESAASASKWGTIIGAFIGGALAWPCGGWFCAGVGAAIGAAIGNGIAGGSYASDLEHAMNAIDTAVQADNLAGDPSTTVVLVDNHNGAGYSMVVNGKWIPVSKEVYDTLKKTFSDPNIIKSDKSYYYERDHLPANIY